MRSIYADDNNNNNAICVGRSEIAAMSVRFYSLEWCTSAADIIFIRIPT